jgi:hypothetical protein
MKTITIADRNGFLIETVQKVLQDVPQIDLGVNINTANCDIFDIVVEIVVSNVGMGWRAKV